MPRSDTPKLLDKARGVAKTGAHMGWREVIAALGDDGASLRIWLTSKDMDELDQLCDQSRIKRR